MRIDPAPRAAEQKVEKAFFRVGRAWRQQRGSEQNAERERRRAAANRKVRTSARVPSCQLLPHRASPSALSRPSFSAITELPGEIVAFPRRFGSGSGALVSILLSKHRLC